MFTPHELWPCNVAMYMMQFFLGGGGGGASCVHNGEDTLGEGT